jgi:hypothetical protein
MNSEDYRRLAAQEAALAGAAVSKASRAQHYAIAARRFADDPRQHARSELYPKKYSNLFISTCKAKPEARRPWP